MKRGGKKPTLPHNDRVPLESGKHLDIPTDTSDPRRTDEHTAERLVERLELDIRFEALYLPAVGVSRHGDVHHAELGLIASLDVLGQKDGARAGAEDRKPCGNSLSYRPDEIESVEEHADGGAFPARDDEGGEAVELGGGAHEACVHLHRCKELAMLLEVPLEGEDSDGGFDYHPLTAMRSVSSMLPTPMPLIGAPRSVEISASVFGSS